MKHFFVALIGIIVLGLLVSACASQSVPVPTIERLEPTVTRSLAASTATQPPTVTIQPSTATPQPSATATRIATAAQSSTPMPTSYPTADRSIPLSSSGPWLSYRIEHNDQHGTVVVVNSDGSGRRELQADASKIVGSSTSPYLAVVVGRTQLQPPASKEAIEIIRLPDLSVVKTIPLTDNPGIEDYIDSHHNPNLTKEWELMVLTVAIGKDPAWSPNGRYLAFTAAIDGPTADLYVYDTLSNQIRRLSDGLDMATQPEWSPNGKWIVHRGMDHYGVGCNESGVWAAAVDGSEVKWLTPGECFTISLWTGPETFETYNDGCHGGGCRRTQVTRKQVNIATGISTALAPHYFSTEFPSPDAFPAHDCLTGKRIENSGLKNNSQRFDAPNEKWFVVVHNDLRLFTADGNLVAEFKGGQFNGWRPDSSAIVFVTPGEPSSDWGTLHYFQVSDRTLKIFPKSLPYDSYGKPIWGAQPASFFMASPELNYFNPLKDQLVRVDDGLSRVDFAWIGIPSVENDTSYRICYTGQP